MIKVFNSTDTTFSTNGNVVLEPTYANVHKEDNGEYYLDIETNLQDEVIKHIDSVAGTTIDTTGTTLTDVDTTKENEITHLKGDTSQSSTPTPSSPQPINVVGGEQNVLVSGNNIFDKNNYNAINASISSSGIYSSANAKTLYIQVNPNTTYTISKVSSARFRVGTTTNVPTTSGTLNQYQSTSETGTTETITTGDNDNYLLVYYYLSGTDTLTEQQIINSVEIVISNTYEINLGKNLFDPVYEVENQYNASGASSSGYTLNDGVISITKNNAYNGRVMFNKITLPSGTYTLSYVPTLSGTDKRIRRSVRDMINYVDIVTTATISMTDGVRQSVTFTLTGTKTISISLQPDNSNGGTLYLTDIQLERGSTDTSYSAYKTPIELCKIGTYQDYIYKSNGVWYLHKEIGKVVIDQNTAGMYQSGSLTNTMRMAVPSGLLLSNVTTNMMCDKLKILAAYSTDSEHIYMASNNFYVFVNKSRGVSDLATFKTWLSTNNLTCYAVLKEATETEITGSLKDQLEALDKLRLFEGTTNIMITPNDLNPILTVHYNYVSGGDVTTGDYLQPNNLLVCNTPTGNQAFRITNVEKTRHKIKIKANHVFYDSMNYVINDSYVVDKNLNDALDHLNNATDNTSPFTTTSNVNTINSFRCVRKSLYEAINVLLERWGGHLVRDNFDIKIMNSIGQDNGVTVRYAKNLKDITVDYNWDNVVTKILPVGYDGVTLDEVYLYSDTQYDIPYTKVVHFDQDIDIDQFRDGDGNVDEDAYTNALKADLRNQASTYLLENAIPKVNYELQANLEKITDVGDIIDVIDERLGINITTSLIAFDYDPILNKYTYIQFGNFQKKLNDLTSYIEAQSSEVANEISTATKVTLQTELNQATSQLWGVLGNSYVIVEGDKILIVDTLPKENATNVIMLNSGGIGFSNTGINGTFTSAWTIDNKLNMENINVINLTADLIKGGTLKLGSNINQNGILEVYDEANNLIAQLNKDGLRMNATDGGYILINTTVGFSGYDRNDNRIYWVDGDEFHMKKSVVEEEITLVDKMRIIPITITDGNNNIVNDGIGWVSTL